MQTTSQQPVWTTGQPGWRGNNVENDPRWVEILACIIAAPFVIFVVVIVGVFIIGGIGFLFAHYTAAAVTTTFVLAMLGLGGFTLYKARQSR